MNQAVLSFIDTRSHRGDPQTSRDAAKHAASTKAQEERIAIRQCLVQHGPLTPRRISELTRIDYHEVHRRMGETAGIERTGERDGKQSIWRAL
jgi:hypothetical protein